MTTLYSVYILDEEQARVKIRPRRGVVGVATVHSGYLSFPRLTPRHTDGQREVFIMISPLYYRLCSPHLDEGSPHHIDFFCGWFAVEPFLPPPRHAGDMRQVLEPFLSPPLTTPAVRGRVLMGAFSVVAGSAFPSTDFLCVFLAP